MSLPPAKKEISEHPAPTAVTEPVDQELNKKDTERKLRLLGVIQAFRNGRLPSNDQIDETLKYVLDHSPVDQEQLSPEGGKLVQDTRDIIETARAIVKEKNRDELFQNFVWHTREVAHKEGLRAQKKERAEEGGEGPVEKAEEDKSDDEKAVQHLRTLISLIFTNSEVRKLVADFSVIGRDLLSLGLKKASGAVAPTKEQLADVDKSAPEGEFVTEGGKKVGSDETPVVEATVPGTEKKIVHEPKEGSKVRGEEGEERHVGDMAREQKDRVMDQARETTAEGRAGDVDKGRFEKGAKDVVGEEPLERAKLGMQETRERARETGEKEARQRGAQDDKEAHVQKKVGGLIGRFKGAKDTLAEKVPHEHRDRIERGKKFLKEEYFPEERREQFLYRLKKVIIECQKHEDYKASIQWLLSYIEHIAEHGKRKTAEHVEGTRAKVDDTPVQRAIHEIRTLLERFANNQNMDPIFDAFYVLADDGKRDKELSDWFKEVNEFVRTVLLQAGYVLEPQCDERAKELRERGRKFYDDKYKEHFDELFSNIGDWLKAMGKDPLNKRFGEDWARLTRNLLFDDDGSLKFKKHLWHDIRNIIVPELVHKVGYIPIPRIEYTDPSLDLVVENLTLSGPNLFPNLVAIEAHNFVKFSPYQTIQDESHHRFTFTLGQMQADMRDVMFYFKKKTGVPKMSDSGVADVILGGQGLTVTVVLVSAGNDKSSVFHVHDVHVKVASLKFSIRDSKHDLLYKTLKPLATGLVKKQIQRAMADAIRTGLEYVDGQLVRVRDRMAEAEEGAEGDEKTRTQRLKEMFQRPADGMKASSSTSSRPSSVAGSEKHFKVVTTKRDSMLSTVRNPAGWITKAAEQEEKARKGQDWRSEAFTIIKGKERERGHGHGHAVLSPRRCEVD